MNKIIQWITIMSLPIILLGEISTFYGADSASPPCYTRKRPSPILTRNLGTPVQPINTPPALTAATFIAWANNNRAFLSNPNPNLLRAPQGFKYCVLWLLNNLKKIAYFWADTYAISANNKPDFIKEYLTYAINDPLSATFELLRKILPPIKRANRSLASIQKDIQDLYHWAKKPRHQQFIHASEPNFSNAPREFNRIVQWVQKNAPFIAKHIALQTSPEEQENYSLHYQDYIHKFPASAAITYLRYIAPPSQPFAPQVPVTSSIRPSSTHLPPAITSTPIVHEQIQPPAPIINTVTQPRPLAVPTIPITKQFLIDWAQHPNNQSFLNQLSPHFDAVPQGFGVCVAWVKNNAHVVATSIATINQDIEIIKQYIRTQPLSATFHFMQLFRFQQPSASNIASRDNRIRSNQSAHPASSSVSYSQQPPTFSQRVQQIGTSCYNYITSPTTKQKVVQAAHTGWNTTKQCLSTLRNWGRWLRIT